jgi:ATP-dependent helicase/nuclease subunit A
VSDAPAYRIDGRTADAAAFYAAACDPRRSVVVEACAGAGKTWVLVSRIVRALLDGAEPSQILAITFTRRAAGEMRERLEDWLAGFASAGVQRCVDELRTRGLDEAAARAQAPALAALHARVLAASRPVEIRTFHGWFAQLLGAAPLALLERLGLPAERALLEEIDTLRVPLLRRFHRRVDADASLRDDYLALVRRHRRRAVLDWLDAAARRATEIGLADAAGTLDRAVAPADVLDPACAGLADPASLVASASWQAELGALAGRLSRSTRAAARQAGERLGQALALVTSDPPAGFDAAWAALFTTAGDERKLGDVPGLGDACERLRRLALLRRQQQAHDDHAAMVRLVRVLLHEYAALKRARGFVDMADLERAALVLLSDPSCAGWVQERLDLRLAHLLIDEFQDTSPLQWQALAPWLASYAGAGGGASGQRPLSVFIVGDPKQSIYRFRRAEPRVFAAARDLVVDAFDGRVLACDHTRRNADAVVQALNAVFADAAQRDGWGPFRAHTTASDAAGRTLRIDDEAGSESSAPARGASPDALRWRDSLREPRHEPEAHRRAPEAARIADAVSALLADGFAPRDVMVVARRRDVLGQVAQALAAAGVPHVRPETTGFADLPEALDLVAVLDVLASPAHDLSLARALKSPLFGAGDEDLLALATAARACGRRWLATLLGSTWEARPVLARAATLLGGLAAAARQLPAHDLLDRIVHEGDLTARLLAAVPPARRATALHAVHALLAASLEAGGGRIVTPYAFVREVRRGFLAAPASPPPDAVRLLTVHGAKGLEARAVVLADTAPADRPPDRATLLVDWPVGSAAPACVAFVASESRPAPTLEPLLADERRERQREELNALYVAVTRAAERLIVSRTVLARSGADTWWQRLEAHATPWRPPRAAPQHDTGTVEVDAAPAARPAAARAAAAVPSGASDPRRGAAVHRLLEWAGRVDRPLPRERWPSAAEAAAREQGLPERAAPAVLDAARAVLESPACRRFFHGPGLRWAGNEVTLAGPAGQTMRADRIVELDDGAGGIECWVLDYKLATAPEALAGHRPQLEAYVAAVAAASPGLRVRGAFVAGDGRVVPL